MTNFHFEFSVSNDKATGALLAAYFHVRKGKASEVKELAGGRAFANYNRQGELLGIELLAPCEFNVLDKVTKGEPKVRKFVRESMPVGMTMPAKTSKPTKRMVLTPG